MKYVLIALALSLTACGQPLYYRPMPMQPVSNPFYIDPQPFMRAFPPNQAPRSTSCQSYMVGTTLQTNCN